MTKKIGIIVNSLAKGGAERSNALVSRICESLGYNVFLIAVVDEVEVDFGGTYICLGNQKTKNSLLRKWTKFLHAYKLFKKEDFDVVIDGRSRPTFSKQFLYKKFVFRNIPKISIVRSAYLNTSFPSKKWKVNNLYKNDYIVTVSKEIERIVKDRFGLKKVHTIYNPVSKEELNKLSCIKKEIPFKYILFYGRMENKSKNLFFLIQSYAESNLIKENVKLILLGEGIDKMILKKHVESLELKNDILFEEYTLNPMGYVKNALFTVMTSNYEGFPRTIIESLTLGTPVVTLDFISGPSEIIETGENGILVKKKSTISFARSLNKMVEDIDFYDSCKKGTLKSVEKFEDKSIESKWNELINEIC